VGEFPVLIVLFKTETLVNFSPGILKRESGPISKTCGFEIYGARSAISWLSTSEVSALGELSF